MHANRTSSVEHVLQLMLWYWKPGTCRSMALFYFFFNDGGEKRMTYKMIKKHFSTAAPWYTIRCNINAIINHTFCFFHVFGSVFNTLCGTGFFILFQWKPVNMLQPAYLIVCSAQLSKPCKCALTKLSAASLYWCHSSRGSSICFVLFPFLYLFPTHCLLKVVENKSNHKKKLYTVSPHKKVWSKCKTTLNSKNSASWPKMNLLKQAAFLPSGSLHSH